MLPNNIPFSGELTIVNVKSSLLGSDPVSSICATLSSNIEMF